ncbi:MAG: TraB/GumN family protein [Nitrospinae bacterium]|nr:TraB/GumN family protein [Nitrospinota bacterium]
MNGSRITLVGTAHVSQKSVDLVEEKIRSGEYDCVAVELCQPRYENIVNQSWWKNLDIYQIFKQKKATLLLINMALSAYQRRLADKIGVEAGMEMQRAIELARERDIQLETIDRSISVTLHRLTSQVSFWQKLKLFSGLLGGVFAGEEITEQQIEDLKRGDLLHAVIDEFGESLPQIKRVLIDERDRYMAVKLAQLAKSPGGPKNILALVGAGHLIGMEPTLASPPGPEILSELDAKPPPSRAGYYIGWGICLFIFSMFFVGFQRSPELGWQLMLTWAIAHGGLSALGAALAFAHPLSIAAAFVAAPFTSLNPTIGAGMVVGLVESYIRKPKVVDFERLRDDIVDMKMWWRNGVVRVFLIFFLANMGSAIGTYVAGASIVRQLLR